MHLLTHAQVALDVAAKKSRDNELLILGSILPDISELGIGNEVRTHTQGLYFLQSLSSAYRSLGIGFILHGEKPRGLDYYTHHGYYAAGKGHSVPLKRADGYIAQVYPQIAPIVRQYTKSFGRLSLDHAIHLVVEFCFDHITAKRHPPLLSLVHKSLRANISRTALITFSTFFAINRKELHRLLRITRARYTGRFLSHFLTLEGTAHNFRNYIFFTSTRESSLPRRALFLQMAKVARSSLDFIQTRIYERSLIEMFERCLPIVERDYDNFMRKTHKELKKMLTNENVL